VLSFSHSLLSTIARSFEHLILELKSSFVCYQVEVFSAQVKQGLLLVTIPILAWRSRNALFTLVFIGTVTVVISTWRWLCSEQLDILCHLVNDLSKLCILKGELLNFLLLGHDVRWGDINLFELLLGHASFHWRWAIASIFSLGICRITVGGILLVDCVDVNFLEVFNQGVLFLAIISFVIVFSLMLALISRPLLHLKLLDSLGVVHDQFFLVKISDGRFQV